MGNDKYKNVTIKGYHFPDSPITTEWKGTFNALIMSEYLPTLMSINGYSEGVKRLALIMTRQEGFAKGTRSYRYNNPGNIGNTDSGANVGYKTLKDGIIAQLNFLIKVANGEVSAYKFGVKKIKPYYSPEIAKNPQYGLPPYLPGYEFDYKGQLGAFVKIYSTGARASNGYLSNIISYLNYKGIKVDENTTLKEIVSVGVVGK